MKPKEQGCTHDEECVNNAGCYIKPKLAVGVCWEYFTVAKHDWVYDCENYTSKLCESYQCFGSGGNGKSVCVDKVEANYLGFECEENSDCPGDNDDWRFYGDCQCGNNGKAQRYCQPFLGDLDGRNYLKWLKAWFLSQDLLKCHTARREASNCIKQWSNYETLLYYYLHYTQYAAVQENDICVQQIYNSQYWDAKTQINPDIDDTSLLLSIGFSIILSVI